MQKIKFPILILLLLYTIIQGCKKETSSIGSHIQPPGDITKTSYIDSTSLRAFTLAEDSLTTNNRTLNLLGSYTDPAFGLSNASFLTQFRLSSYISFGTNPVSDSLVLYMKYSSAYPLSTMSTPQTITIYKLTKQIYFDTTYYSNFNINSYYDSTASSILATFTYTPNLTDSILKIKLSPAIADTLLNLPSAGLNDNSLFVSKYFRGMFMKASNVYAGGSVQYFNLLSTDTKLVIYYRNSDDAVEHNFSYLVNSSCSRINLFHHNFTGTPFSSRIAVIDTIHQDSVVYLESMCGVNVKVSFPFIQKYLTSLGTVAINKAVLVLNDVTPDESNYPVPAQLIALMNSTTATTGYSFLPDYNAGTTYFDGNYYSTSKCYKFNITMYIQGLISGKYKNKGIYIFAMQDRITANRVILSSGKNLNPMKLLITYTKL